MKFKLSILSIVSLLLLFGLVSVAAAQEPTGDASVVQQAADAISEFRQSTRYQCGCIVGEPERRGREQRSVHRERAKGRAL